MLSLGGQPLADPPRKTWKSSRQAWVTGWSARSDKAFELGPSDRRHDAPGIEDHHRAGSFRGTGLSVPVKTSAPGTSI